MTIRKIPGNICNIATHAMSYHGFCLYPLSTSATVENCASVILGRSLIYALFPEQCSCAMLTADIIERILELLACMGVDSSLYLDIAFYA